MSVRRRLGHLLVVIVLGATATLPVGGPARAALGAPIILGPTGTIPTAEPVFRWTEVPGASFYRIRLITPAGADPLDTVNTTFAGEFQLKRGLVEWTVAAVDESGLESPSKAASFLINPQPPTLYGPADGAVLDYPDDTIAFAADDYQNYRLPILYRPASIDPPPDDPMGGMLIHGHNEGMLPPGDWEWGAVEAFGAVPSEVRRLTVRWPRSTPVLTAPADDSILDLPAQAAWQPVTGAMEYQVQVDDDPAFGSPATWATRATSATLWGESTDTFWRLRARALSSTLRPIYGPWSEVRSYRARPLHPPTIVGPADGVTLPEPPVLEWEPVDGAISYYIETAIEPNHPNRSTDEVVGTVAVARPTAAGTATRWWRVASVYDHGGGYRGPGAWTPWQSYTVTPSSETLAAPVAVTPAAPVNCTAPASCERFATSPLLDWPAVPGASFYRLFLGPGGAPAPTGWVDLTSSARLIGNLEGYGDSVQWLPVACGSPVDCPTESPAGVWRFRVGLPAPTVDVAPDTTIPGTTFDLEWSSQGALHAQMKFWQVAQVRVRPDGTRVSMNHLWLSGRQRSLAITDIANGEGREIRVRGITAAGVTGDWWEAITVRRASPQAVPLLPSPGATVEDRVRFSWEAQAGLTHGYEVEVWRQLDPHEAASWHPIWSATVNGTTADMSHPLPSGEYRWRVRKSWMEGSPEQWPEHNGVETWSAFRTFEVPQVPPPTLTAPAAGASVRADRAVFEWTPVVNADTYVVEIATAPSFADDVLVGRLSTSTITTAALRTRLPLGPVYWRVRAASRGAWHGAPSSGSFDSALEIGTSAVQSVMAVSSPDRAGPVGTVSIASGAAAVRSGSVTLATPATDAGSEVTHVSLSNDGTTWTNRTYAPTQSWTLTAGNGTKSVHVRWRDAAGNWSASKTDTVLLDTAVPTVGPPRASLLAGASLVRGAVPVRVAWSGGDSLSGIGRYELRQQVGSGTWTTVNANLTSPGITLNLLPGQTYRFAVRAWDKAGNVSGYTYGTSSAIAAMSEAHGATRYTGTWGRATSTGYWGGAVRYATAPTARATFTFTGRSVGFVSTMSSSRGRAAIYVNGVYIKTIDLYSGTWRNGVVAWSQSWSTLASRTVEIRVLGTAGRPRVDLDGWVVGT